VRRWGDRPAFVEDDVPLTFGELGARAHAVANWLADSGVGRGDVVAVHIPNCRQYPAVYYGVLLAGATFSPTNPLLPAADLAAQLTDAGARVLVTWDQVLPLVRTVLAGTRVETVVVTGRAHVADLAARLGGLGAGEVDLAELLAADPADRRLDAGLDPAAELALLGPEHLGEGRLINLTPWFHAMGAIGYLNGLVLAGVTTVVHPRFDPVRYLEDAVRYRVTSVGGAPPVFVALLQVPGIQDATCPPSAGCPAAPPRCRCR